MRRPGFLGVSFGLAVLALDVPAVAAPSAAPLNLKDAIATALARNRAYLQSAA